MIDRLERAQEIYKNELYSAQLEGEKIGRAREKAEGEVKLKEKTIAIAQSLLEAGMSIFDISRHTGATEDEIRKLAY